MPRLFFHVGLHKTATTYLQQSVFPNWPGVCYLGKPYQNRFLEKMVWSRSDVFLISNEQYSSPPIGPLLIDGKVELWRQRESCLERLQSLFPGAGVLICLRRPSELLLSLYSQYVSSGGTVDLSDFWSEDSGVIHGKDLMFSDLLDGIAKRGQVFPFDYDEIRSNETFFEKMAAFIGVSSLPKRKEGVLNPRLTQRVAEELREFSARQDRQIVLTREFRTKLKRLKQKLTLLDETGEPLMLPEDLRSRINAFYEKDWNLTLELMRSLRQLD